MKKYLKYLIAAAITVVVVTLVVFVVNKIGKKSNPREIVSLVVKNKEKLAELVTYRYSRDTVLFETAERTGLKSFFDDSPDTVAVLLVRPTLCAGLDLRCLKSEDFRIGTDTIYVTLPAPKVLDVYVNHSDITRIYTARGWNFDGRIGQMAQQAKASFKEDALSKGVLLKAKARAESSFSEFLTLMCRMPVVATCEPVKSATQFPASTR